MKKFLPLMAMVLLMGSFCTSARSGLFSISLKDQLRKAIETDDLQTFKNVLSQAKKEINWNKINKKTGNTLFATAVKLGRSEFVKFMVSEYKDKLDINKENKMGQGPLDLALDLPLEQSLWMEKFLLDHGAKWEKGFVAHKALQQGKLTFLKNLISHDPKVLGSQGFQGQGDLLSTAVRTGKLEQVEFLLGTLPEGTSFPWNMELALINAIRLKNAELFHKLIAFPNFESGSDTPEQKEVLKKLMNEAIKVEAGLPIAKTILGKLSLPDHHYSDRETILNVAVRTKNLELAKAILENGADPDLVLPNGVPSLETAISGNNLPMVQLLLKYKANPNTRTTNFEKVLAFAVRISLGSRWSLEIVQALLDHGASPKTKTYSKLPVLDMAVNYSNLPLARMLLQKGASPNHNGLYSPKLIQALRNRNHNMVHLLLDHGADPNGKEEGLSPLSVALNNFSEVVAESLLKKGANPNGRHENHELFLERALKNQNFSAIVLLLKYGADPERKNTRYQKLSDMQLNQNSVIPSILNAHKLANVQEQDPNLNTKLLEIFHSNIGKLIRINDKEGYFNTLLRFFLNNGPKNHADLVAWIEVAKTQSLRISSENNKEIFHFQRPFYLGKLEALEKSERQDQELTREHSMAQGCPSELPEILPQKVIPEICLICRDSFNDAEKNPFPLLNCQCPDKMMCHDCAGQYFSHGQDNGVFPFPCPFDCKKEIAAEDLEKAGMAPEKVLDYRQRVVLNKLATLPSWKPCKGPNCFYGTFQKDNEPGSKIFSCDLCLKKLCLDCGHDHPEQVECEVFKKGENGFQDLVDKNIIQFCPNCRAPSVRIDNCLHVVCQTCKKKWNYQGEFREVTAGWK